MAKESKEEERAEHFRNAFSNYMTILDGPLEKELAKADKGLTFPDSPDDILEYLGNIEPLELDQEEKDTVREWIQKDLDRKGAEYVWQYKIKHKLELHYVLRHF